MAREIEKYTMSEVIGYLSVRAAGEFDLSQVFAKRVVLDALTYNVVVASVMEQVSFLLASNDE